jgi:chromosomal replication initiator protein
MRTLWKRCLEEIEKQVLPENFHTWFSPTYPCDHSEGTLTLAVPNVFFKKCLEENYVDLIENTLENVTRARLRVSFQVHAPHGDGIGTSGHEDSLPAQEKNNNGFKNNALGASSLNPKYVFSNFVVGSSNQFAHAACQAVATNPATAYNPLFVYGPVGLGKTHLMHAIGNEIRLRHPDALVRYISAENFTVDLIQSIKRDEMPAFRRRYRPLDVLLVDDIQFIAGKERTQEEFFYTFNSLYESHKQVVLSSDHYPKDMHNMEERLRSRLESGLIADIKHPDLETKVAILFKKAEQHAKTLPHEVAVFIAGNIKSNIRELEGFLLRVIAYSSFIRRPINLELAKEVLKEFTHDKSKNFNVTNIQKAVAIHFNLKVSDLKSARRSRDISIPRQIAMFLAREYTQNSLPDIGKQFGGKDHTTVLCAHKKISIKTKENSELANTIEDLIRRIETA